MKGAELRIQTASRDGRVTVVLSHCLPDVGTRLSDIEVSALKHAKFRLNLLLHKVNTLLRAEELACELDELRDSVGGGS